MNKKPFSGQVFDADLRQLRIFKSVVNCGGFASAEAELGISRPAISMAISDLEARLNLRLCLRGRAGFSLTEDGREVYQSVLQLLTSLDTFKSQVNALHGSLRGELNIGITGNLVSIERMNITSALAGLKAKGPDVKINIKMLPPDKIESGVIDGQLHVGVIPQAQAMTSLDYLPLYEEQSQLYCATNHLLSRIDKPTTKQVIASEMVVSAYLQHSSVKQIEQQFNATATASDREGVAFLILTGAFIGFLPTHYANQWVADNTINALLKNKFKYSTQYAAITRTGARPNIVVETFMEELGRGTPN